MTVIDWLLDSDPSIRWQALRDLCDGRASRWNTLRALRVLRWVDRSPAMTEQAAATLP